MAIEWTRYGKPSLVGIVTGMVAGLATITPASGFVGPIGGFFIGLAGGLACYKAVQMIKHRLEIDDSLDVFAVHGVGGILGTMLVAIFASSAFEGVGLADGVGVIEQFGVQMVGVVAVVVWSAAISFVVVKATSAMTGLRLSEDEISQGLDLSAHGESGYSL
jgi:Amt family ammonium transporter